MPIYCEFQELAWCCGVFEVGDFSNSSWGSDGSLEGCIEAMKDCNTTGYIVATFINTPECYDAYKILCANTKLIKQTKPKVNKAHINNEVFVAIFDCKGKK